MTDRLYNTDAYLTKFKAKVISCVKAGELYEAVLDRTAFFPEGGGQAADRGVIAGAEVLDVQERGEDIVHFLPSAVSGEVSGEIDFAVRFDRMQQHTGEHIVCGIVHSMYGYDNVGFHLADDYVTFDFNGPLTREQADEVERLANEAVQKNARVFAYFPESSELDSLEYRSKLELTENVRIVDIDGVDRCACCAPHVKMTGEVGVIKLTDVQSYKGGVRITLACGQRALLDYQSKQNNLTEIAKKLSATPDNAAEFFERYVSDVAKFKAELSELKKENISLRAGALEPKDRQVIFERGLDMNALRHFANAISDKYSDFCIIFSGDDGSGYVFNGAAKTRDMRDIAAVLRQKLSAKGGGSAQMIQGSISASRKDIENIIKTL